MSGVELAAAPAPQMPERSMTLQDLMALMAVIDQADDLPELDYAALLGDLKDKVDNIHYVLQRMDTVAAFLKDYVKPIDAKRRSIEREYARLREYVAKAMRGDFLPEDKRQRTEMIPGNTFFVRLRNSNPSLRTLREATALDFEKFPHLVEMKRSYVWKNDAVKAGMIGELADKDGNHVEKTLDPATGRISCDFAEITVGVWPEFRVRVPEQLEKRRKGAKKK